MEKQNQRERLENVAPSDLETRGEAELAEHLEKISQFLELKKKIRHTEAREWNKLPPDQKRNR